MWEINRQVNGRTDQQQTSIRKAQLGFQLKWDKTINKYEHDIPNTQYGISIQFDELSNQQ